MALRLGARRLLVLFLPILLVLIFVISALQAGSPAAPFLALKDGASSIYHKTPRPPLEHGFSNVISVLYEPIKLPVTAESYTDQRGHKWDNGGRHYWQERLGNDVLIVDMDTRIPNEKNDIFNDHKMDWEAVRAVDSGLLTVGHINHFVYAQIHGYDYKYIHAKKMKGYHDAWIKPHLLKGLLPSYKFIIYLDADAIIQHLEVPMEFLFNRWDISPNTSIAMPIDTRELPNDDEHHSTDSKGKMVLNAGIIFLQNLPYSHDMLQAWIDCPDEKRYPGCARWKNRWSNEQRAFSEYIRYDFNPSGNNIVEIPCNEAHGYPGLFGKGDVVDDCHGEFISHHTLDKDKGKTSVSDAIMQNLGELLQKNFAENRKDILIEEQ